MPTHDFVSCLEEAGLTAAEFATVVGECPDRIRAMMIGLRRVPYVVSLVATMLTVRDARELAIIHAEIQPEQPYVEPSWRQKDCRPAKRGPSSSLSGVGIGSRQSHGETSNG